MNILFICTGNTCRSPMACALLRKKLKEAGRDDITVESCGLSVNEGEGASENAIAVLKEIGIDLSGHRARQVTQEMLDKADKIYVLSNMHLHLLSLFSRHSAEKAKLLGDGISDPFSGDLDTYRATRDLIIKSLEPIIKECLESGQEG